MLWSAAVRFLKLFRNKLGLIGEQKDDEMLIKSLLWVSSLYCFIIMLHLPPYLPI